jgi:glyoxylase-like metal-dependent hydrolase (beta-lactamase superfamily II)
MNLPPSLRVVERGWLSANNVVFMDAAGASVVDTGYCTHAAQTVALMEHVLQGLPLARIINTHLHSDHCGGNAALR